MSSPMHGDDILTTLSFPEGEKRFPQQRTETLWLRSPQDASNVPSGLNLTEDIDCVCPLKVVKFIVWAFTT
jgi:hypothetical protein